MEKLSQEYTLSMLFRNSLDREDLLTKKYNDYYDAVKDNEIREILKDSIKCSREHIDLLKDKMIKLNIKG